eukprot:CAMPEP_0174276282 /NCGR_PEP_ID=MMETSP0439-20130205/60293_1 /TAXON_ID=0 /ORGANISM="Stereomyxa ramosa, Strain Chinc5" /LENGTH=190 /DNA_ID=CAMNT_0015368485 /DNA_START=1129 /DNA_END=1701 /DNA_ORIENTATION=-
MQRTRKALVAVANGSEDIEAISIIDTLRRGGLEVTVASGERTKQVTFGRQTTFIADALISDCSSKSYDLIVVPGGLGGAKTLGKCKTLIDMLKAQKEQGKFVAAICAAPAIVLAANGLLDGVAATCYPADQFVQLLPITDRVEERVVVDGNIVTSRAPGTALEFSLTLVELLMGKQKAQSVQEAMLVPSY